MRLGRILTVVSVLGLLWTSPAGAGQEDFICTGEIIGATIDADLIVPEDAFCIIIGTTVKGGVTAVPNAIGFHAHDSRIRDAVYGDRPQLDIRVLDTLVGGDVTVLETHPGTVGAICRSDIGGDVELRGNGGGMYLGDTGFGGVCFAPDAIHGNLVLAHNTGTINVREEFVDGHVFVHGNRGDVRLTYNHIEGDLLCGLNRPAPFVEENRVHGVTTRPCREP
jgi:hypothetical protein